VFPIGTKVTGLITESHNNNVRFYGQFGLSVRGGDASNDCRFAATLSEIEPVNHRITGELFGYCPDYFVRDGITFTQYAGTLL
jgi:hypothetical protein